MPASICHSALITGQSRAMETALSQPWESLFQSAFDKWQRAELLLCASIDLAWISASRESESRSCVWPVHGKGISAGSQSAERGRGIPQRDEPTEAGARASVSRAALITEPTADTPWRVFLLLWRTVDIHPSGLATTRHISTRQLG